MPHNSCDAFDPMHCRVGIAYGAIVCGAYVLCAFHAQTQLTLCIAIVLLPMKRNFAMRKADTNNQNVQQHVTHGFVIFNYYWKEILYSLKEPSMDWKEPTWTVNTQLPSTIFHRMRKYAFHFNHLYFSLSKRNRMLLSIDIFTHAYAQLGHNSHEVKNAKMKYYCRTYHVSQHWNGIEKKKNQD